MSNSNDDMVVEEFVWDESAIDAATNVLNTCDGYVSLFESRRGLVEKILAAATSAQMEIISCEHQNDT